MKRTFMWLVAPTAVAVASLALNVAGCGTDEGSDPFVEDGGPGSSGISSGTSGISSGTSGISSGTSGTSGTSGDLGDGAACEAATSRAQKLPLKMLIALDQSGSMGNHAGYTNLETRWKPVTAALRSFLGTPASAGITASMRLFPHENTKSISCKNEAYATPDVALTALPNLAPFDAVLVDNPENNFTPTRAVLNGTMKEAKALAAADPETKVVMLLITDGEPLYCGDDDPNNDIDGAVAEVEGKGIPMYVIGLGEEDLKPNLTALANAGGTGVGDAGTGIGPIFVDTGNPETTQTQFTTALNEIRNKLASCDVSIPPAPAGKTFDRDKVNVTLTSGAGVISELGYDPSCAGAGWKYDDPNAPTKILLCPTTCEPVKADPASQVDVAFGCGTRPAGVH